jgi:ABC-2 type transport system permease protein
MNLFQSALVVARRDFIALVATPTFLIFLLAPLFFVMISIGGGAGGAYLAASSDETKPEVVVALADAQFGAKLKAADGAMRKVYGNKSAVPGLSVIVPSTKPEAQAKALFADENQKVIAVAFGDTKTPVIIHKMNNKVRAHYLALLYENVARAERGKMPFDTQLTTPQVTQNEQIIMTKSDARSGLASAAVLILFMLTLMLASQALGMLAEEKSNKVIEILTASIPLESVFIGKLMGMLGVSFVFIAFWVTLTLGGVSFIPQLEPLANYSPAIGWPLFLLFGFIYFSLAFLLLSAAFLGVGAHAATMREIQMMSFPITILQMAIFALALTAAAKSGTWISTFAEIFPFSSPYAMAARGANDATIWPHFLAIGWQVLWVAMVVMIGVKAFRLGVLKSGPGFFSGITRWFSGKKKEAH